MPSTSPYTQNDYQAVSNFRPYELPINDIFKAISAQNQFWDAGAARVKSVYDNALNLNLTLDANKEVKKNFLQDVEKQLTKLSTMDLGDASVQRQGFNLFKPLFKDEAIIQDSHLTDLISSIYNEADKYKRDEKTKGSGFHMDNLAYALMPFEGFGKDTPREKVKDIFNKAKHSEYIPFYDDSKEKIDILKNCEYNEYSKTTEQGMYLNEEKVKSRTSSMIYGCLMGGLSDQAKQQARISGAVRYRNDYETLKKEYVESATDALKYNEKEINRLSAQKAAISGKTEPQYEEFRKSLTFQIDMLKESSERYNTKLNGNPNDKAEVGILNWDEQYMKNNYEDLAFQSYFSKKYQTFADAFARTKIEEDKKADPIQMMYYTQQQENDRLDKSLASRERLEKSKIQAQILSGEGDAISKIMAANAAGVPLSELQIAQYMGTAVEEDRTSLDVLDKNITTTSDQIANLSNQIKGDLLQIKDLVPIANSITDEKSLLKEVPNILTSVQGMLASDPNNAAAKRLKQGLDSLVTLQNSRMVNQVMIDEATKKATENHPEIARNAEEQKLTIINNLNKEKELSSKGVKLGESDILLMLKGTHPRFTIKYEKSSGRARQFNLSGTYGMGSSSSEGAYYDSYIYDNTTNKKINFSADQLRTYQNSIYNVNNNKASNIKSKINQYLGENTVVQKTVLATGNLLGSGKIDDVKATPMMKVIQSVFGSNLGDVKFNSISGIDEEGWVDIQALDKKSNPISKSDLEDAISKNGMYGSSILGESKSSNAIRIKISDNMMKALNIGKPSAWNEINTFLTYAENVVTKNRINNGIVHTIGLTPQGNEIKIKTVPGLGSSSADYYVIVGNKSILMDTKEQAIQSVISLREGKVNN